MKLIFEPKGTRPIYDPHPHRTGDYIEKLPKKEHDGLEWQTAIRDLMRAAAGHGPWRFFARIAIMTALYGKMPPPIGNPNDAPPAPKWRG